MLSKRNTLAGVLALILLTLAILPLSTVLAASATVDWNDNFGVAALEDRWSWIREDATHWSLTDWPGKMKITTQQGGGPTARNLLVQQAPVGDYMIETYLEFTPTTDYHMAGLLVYLDDTHYLILRRAYCTPGAQCVGNGIYFDHVSGGSFTGDNYATTTIATGTVYLRLVKAGGTYYGYYSENYTDWTLIGSHTPTFAPDQIGLTAHTGGQPAPDIPAYFIHFRVISRTWQEDFADTTLADRWSWVREDSGNWSLTDRPGFLRITTQQGSGPTARNLLLQEAPIGDYVIETYLEFMPLENFNFAGLLLYLDDDNYLALGRAYCSPGDDCVGNGIYFDHISQSSFTGENFAMTTTDMEEAYLRVVKSGQVYIGYFSPDGETWTLVGAHTARFEPDRVGLLAQSSTASTANILADFDGFMVRSTVPADLFHDPALNADWNWVREDPTHWTLENYPGFLTITTQIGGLFGPGGDTKNLLLQEVPLGDFAMEARLNFLPTENFHGAGLIVYLDDDNYIKLIRAFCNVPGGCVGNGIYFDHEAGGATVGSNFATLKSYTNIAYLRLVRTGNTYAAYVSQDGGVWDFIGSHTAAFTPTQVGLIADHGPASIATNAYFNYFALDDRTPHLFLPMAIR